MKGVCLYIKHRDAGEVQKIKVNNMLSVQSGTSRSNTVETKWRGIMESFTT